jgi:hypothetical protein
MTYDDWKTRDESRENQEPTFWCETCEHGWDSEADCCDCPCCNGEGDLPPVKSRVVCEVCLQEGCSVAWHEANDCAPETDVEF